MKLLKNLSRVILASLPLLCLPLSHIGQGMPVDRASLVSSLKASLPSPNATNTFPANAIDEACFSRAYDMFKLMYEREFVTKSNPPYNAVNLEEPSTFAKGGISSENHMRANLSYEKTMTYLNTKYGASKGNHQKIVEALFEADDPRSFAKLLIRKDEQFFTIEDNQVYYIAQSLYKYMAALDQTITFSPASKYEGSFFSNSCKEGSADISGAYLSNNKTKVPNKSLLTEGFTYVITGQGGCSCASGDELTNFNIRYEVRIEPKPSADKSRIVFQLAEQKYMVDIACCNGGTVSANPNASLPQNTTATPGGGEEVPSYSDTDANNDVYTNPAPAEGTNNNPTNYDWYKDDGNTETNPATTPAGPISSAARNQFLRPKDFVGGTVSFGYYGQGSFSEFSPSLGVAGHFSFGQNDTSGITPAVGLGLGGTYTSSTQRDFSSSGYRVQAMPMVTIFFNGTFRNNAVTPYLRVAGVVGYGSNTNTFEGSVETVETTTNILQVSGNLVGGIFIMVSENVGIDIGFNIFGVDRFRTEDDATNIQVWSQDTYRADVNRGAVSFGVFTSLGNK